MEKSWLSAFRNKDDFKKFFLIKIQGFLTKCLISKREQIVHGSGKLEEEKY